MSQSKAAGSHSVRRWKFLSFKVSQFQRKQFQPLRCGFSIFGEQSADKKISAEKINSSAATILWNANERFSQNLFNHVAWDFPWEVFCVLTMLIWGDHSFFSISCPYCSFIAYIFISYESINENTQPWHLK